MDDKHLLLDHRLNASTVINDYKILLKLMLEGNYPEVKNKLERLIDIDSIPPLDLERL